MCTITLAWQCFEEAPLIVAANRDEFLDRPSEPPAPRDWGRQVIAPQDKEAAGTWIGYNDAGVLVAITNRWTPSQIDGDRSRGLLVRDALGESSADEAMRLVERELDERAYEGFNLVVADSTSALLAEYDGNRRISTLDPGVHVVVNVGADGNYDIPARREADGTQQASNADAVRTALRPEPGESGEEWLDRAATVVGDHEYGVCIHREQFGTRSSSLLYVGEAETRYRYADGPPCETAFEPVEVPFA
ncbi:hypothetical protein GRX03_11060 [Halovenus sp. WSH3]|uniref:NRDE family protein n=1 Tax=Halovenus carboxidivorans TaxID=2692199 RepID=A0A6B0T7F1_9EURY|nr:hypothetical protein [Halovenus carboxidivorans]